MAKGPIDWIRRHRTHVMTIFAGLLLAVVVVQGFLLFEQRTAIRAAETQSAKLLTKFLEGDTAQVSGERGVAIRLENVRFKWSDKVYIDADNMAVRAVPLEGTAVDFDDLTSFHLIIQKSVVVIRPDVLAGMLNESIFNYPESRIRDLTVAIHKDDHGVRLVELRGKVQVLGWIPFTMYSNLSVDTKTNTLVIAVDHLKVFGHIPATKMIRWTPLHLHRLIALPPNKSLMVDGDRIMVKPFALFPPPRVNGTIASVSVDDNAISISFAGDAIPAPASSARNYVYLRGGLSRFGSFRMADTDVLILDQNPANPFVFSLLHYAEMIPRSKVEIPNTKSARITMPDQ